MVFFLFYLGLMMFLPFYLGLMMFLEVDKVFVERNLSGSIRFNHLICIIRDSPLDSEVEDDEWEEKLSVVGELCEKIDVE